VISSDFDLRTAHFETIWRCSPLAMAFWDTELRFTRVNDVAARMNGLSVEQHYDKTFRDVVGDEVADATEPAMWHVLDTGEPMLDVEGAGTWPTGEARHFLSRIHPVFDDEGTVIGVGALTLEISDRVELEYMRTHGTATTVRTIVGLAESLVRAATSDMPGDGRDDVRGKILAAVREQSAIFERAIETSSNRAELHREEAAARE
jgi:PAS domain S-box-containing protein